MDAPPSLPAIASLPSPPPSPHPPALPPPSSPSSPSTPSAPPTPLFSPPPSPFSSSPAPLSPPPSPPAPDEPYARVGNGRDIVHAATEEALALRAAIIAREGTPAMLALATALRRAEDGHHLPRPLLNTLYEAAVAEDGAMPAMCFLGYYFESGIASVPVNHTRARWLFHKDIVCNDCDLARFALAGSLTDESPGENDPARAVQLYEVALHNKGYNLVARHLAALLDVGAEGVPPDPPRAVSLYERAVAHGASTEAMYSLARIYTEGRQGVPPDPPRAVQLYERAVNDANSSKAMNSLALLLQDGAMGVPVDVQRAVNLFERAIDMGNCDAMNNLAFLISEGYDGVPRDMPRVATLYERAIQGGNVVSMRNLARLLKSGDDGIPQDKPRALELFERLTEDPEMYHTVRFEIALLISSDADGIPLDTIRAAEIYSDIIAEDSSVSAMFNLACMLSDGRGALEQDNSRAAALYELAILEGDDVLSMLNLGIMLGTENEGVEEDLPRSVALLERAAQEGRKEANYHLGVVLAGFNGRALDVHRSVELFEQCIADLDHIGAMIDLSVVIGEGQHGVEPDVQRALELSERAIALGLENNRPVLKEMGIFIDENVQLREDQDAVRERNHAISRGSHLISMLNLAELLISGKVPWDADRAVKLCEYALNDPNVEKVCRFIQMDDLLKYTRKMGLETRRGENNGAKAEKICQWIMDATEGINSEACGHAARVYGQLLLAGADGVPYNVDKAVEVYKRAVAVDDKKSMLVLGSLMMSGAPGIPADELYAFDLMGKIISGAKCEITILQDATVIMAHLVGRRKAAADRQRRQENGIGDDVAEGVEKALVESSTAPETSAAEQQVVSDRRSRRGLLRHISLAIPIVRYVWTRSW